MKKLYAILLFIFTLSQLHATTHTITVADFQFTPDSLNAECGDTIKWVWVSGMHTTWTSSAPAAATTWFESIDSLNPTYSYTVTVPGTYEYYCYFHPMMTGSIIVTCNAGMASLHDQESSLVYPNPFVNHLSIETMDATSVCIYTLAGEKIKTIAVPRGQAKTEMNTSDLGAGMYLCAVFKEGVLVETRKLVKY